VCERRKNSRQTRSICHQQFANVFADCFCAVHTHQLEFANKSLPTLFCRVKAALEKQDDIIGLEGMNREHKLKKYSSQIHKNFLI